MRSLLSLEPDALREVDECLFALEEDVLVQPVRRFLADPGDEELLLLVEWTNEFARRVAFKGVANFEPEGEPLLCAVVEWKSGGRDAFFFNLLSCFELKSFLPKNFSADIDEIDCWDIFVE